MKIIISLIMMIGILEAKPLGNVAGVALELPLAFSVEHILSHALSDISRPF